MTIQSRLQEIRDRADKATEGPWSTYFATGESPGIVQHKVRDDGYFDLVSFVLPIFPKKEIDWLNAEFIAHARTDIPKLLAVIEKLIEQREVYAERAKSGDYESDNAELLAILEGK